MASFDFSSLFTNIRIDEICTIIVYSGFRCSDFPKIVYICTKNNMFLFNKELYQQKDGTPMGGCLSPSLANIFLSCLELVSLEKCPTAFIPDFYRRYVDDAFLLFRAHSHTKLFFDYLNIA